jgi:hypothetical protein
MRSINQPPISFAARMALIGEKNSIIGTMIFVPINGDVYSVGGENINVMGVVNFPNC